MAQSFAQAGAKADLIHINDLIANPSELENSQILAFPGGFAYGDDLGAGVALANRLRNNLYDDLLKFISRDTLTIGICNGFQMMANLGIVPGLAGDQLGTRKVALKRNKNGRYNCRWTHIKRMSDKCVFLRGIDVLSISVGHGEGNFYAEPEVLDELKANDQIAVQYCDAEGKAADGMFPLNPNGAMEDIAGICDHTGRIFALMPHPDRFLTAYSQPDWTLQKEIAKRKGEHFSDESPAQKIYQNAVNYFVAS